MKASEVSTKAKTMLANYLKMHYFCKSCSWRFSKTKIVIYFRPIVRLTSYEFSCFTLGNASFNLIALCAVLPRGQ